MSVEQKYLFFDLDGTLKGSSREVTAATKAKLLQVQKAGHKTFLCSGRSPEFLIRTICREIGFDGIVGCAGGSVVLDGKCIFENSIPEERLQELLCLFEELDMDYSLETTSGIFQTPGIIREIDKFHEALRLKDQKAYESIRAEEGCGANMPVEEYKEKSKSVQKICFMTYRQENFETFSRNVEKDFHIVIFINHDGFVFGEIIPHKATKARGIQAVLDYYGSNQDQTIGFGDSMNDYQMMEYVGTRVVREDGAEELQKLADYTFIDPDRDGIALVLDKLIEDGIL